MHYLCGFKTSRGHEGAVMVFSRHKWHVHDKFQDRMRDHSKYLFSDPRDCRPFKAQMSWYIPESAVRRIRKYEN